MNYTFQLKEPKSTKETLIYFVSNFKDENKKFGVGSVCKVCRRSNACYY